MIELRTVYTDRVSKNNSNEQNDLKASACINNKQTAKTMVNDNYCFQTLHSVNKG